MRRVIQLTVLLCLILSLTSAVKLNKATQKRKDICTLESSCGSCHGSQRKWYYNFISDRCTTFIWSGCGGNQNRFNTESECNRFCLSPDYKYNLQDFENDYY